MFLYGIIFGLLENGFEYGCADVYHDWIIFGLWGGLKRVVKNMIIKQSILVACNELNKVLMDDY